MFITSRSVSHKSARHAAVCHTSVRARIGAGLAATAVLAAALVAAPALDRVTVTTTAPAATATAAEVAPVLPATTPGTDAAALVEVGPITDTPDTVQQWEAEQWELDPAGGDGPIDCGRGQILAEDLTCVPMDYYLDPESAPVDAEPVVNEDEAGFDCRTMGNRTCGVAGSDGQTYLVEFDAAGAPVLVTPQG